MFTTLITLSSFNEVELIQKLKLIVIDQSKSLSTVAISIGGRNFTKFEYGLEAIPNGAQSECEYIDPTTGDYIRIKYSLNQVSSQSYSGIKSIDSVEFFV